MSDNLTSNSSANRKRTLISLVVAFLLIGGGIFTFLIFQGLGDLKGDGAGNFTYGFAARNIVLPLSNYFSLGDNDLGVARRTGEKLTVKGAQPSLLDGASADVSDWMAKGAAGSNTGASAGGASSASPQSAGRTVVPKMGGGLGSAVGGGGGGGSKSSGSPSKFSAGSDASNTSVTGAKDGKGFGQSKSGTLNALSSARAALSDGLKSGSAMTAKAKWDQGFGLGTTGKKAGDLAYGKSGLVGLDHIKQGDIADLKMTDAKSLKTAEPKPEEDKESEAKDPNLAKMAGKEGADAANQAASSAVGAVRQNQDKAGPGAPKLELPPPDVIKRAMSEPPAGAACFPGSKCAASSNYADDPNRVTFTKRGNDWVATYVGKDGSAGTDYRDAVLYVEGQPPKPLVSCIDQPNGCVKTCEPCGNTLCP